MGSQMEEKNKRKLKMKNETETIVQLSSEELLRPQSGFSKVFQV